MASGNHCKKYVKNMKEERRTIQKEWREMSKNAGKCLDTYCREDGGQVIYGNPSEILTRLLIVFAKKPDDYAIFLLEAFEENLENEFIDELFAIPKILVDLNRRRVAFGKPRCHTFWESRILWSVNGEAYLYTAEPINTVHLFNSYTKDRLY